LLAAVLVAVSLECFADALSVQKALPFTCWLRLLFPLNALPMLYLFRRNPLFAALVVVSASSIVKKQGLMPRFSR
jgi:hypothetical protein